MKILITGVGITGKSTFRRLLRNALREMGLRVAHFDADCFKEVRHPADADCLQTLPRVFMDEMVYIVEDVHGPTVKAIAPLANYDIVIYLKPSLLSLIRSWTGRSIIWFRKGNFAWEAGIGWRGTGKPRDLRNVFPILRELVRSIWRSRAWIREDLQKITPVPHIIVCSRLQHRGGMEFTVTTSRR